MINNRDDNNNELKDGAGDDTGLEGEIMDEKNLIPSGGDD